MTTNKNEKGQTCVEVAIVIAIIVLIIIFVGWLYKKSKEFLDSKIQERQSNTPAETVIFSGRVVDVVSGTWPNNRLVVLFLNGKEIARSKSMLGEFRQSGEGIHDGLFIIEAKNTYNLTENDFNFDGNKGVNFAADFGKNWLFPKDTIIYRWFGNVEEDTFIDIPIPSKNLKFIVYIFSDPFDTLSTEIQQDGSLALKQDRNIYVNGQPIQ